MQQRRSHSRVIFGLLSLTLCGGAVLMSSPAQADTGAGPYYAEPSWNRTLPANARFMVLTNFASAAVLDRETGLVWERSPRIDPVDWFGASERCVGNAIGGRKGWRLPSISELTSLIDPSVRVAPGVALPLGHPFDVGLSNLTFWSATTHARTLTDAWSAEFASGNNDGNNGDAESDRPKTSSGPRAWCVRGGQSHADAY
jgi:hypothetical protein